MEGIAVQALQVLRKHRSDIPALVEEILRTADPKKRQAIISFLMKASGEKGKRTEKVLKEKTKESIPVFSVNPPEKTVIKDARESFDLPSLMANLTGRDSDLGVAAINALVKSARDSQANKTKILLALKVVVETGDWRAAQRSITVLEEIGGEEIIPCLVGALKNEDWGVQYLAVETLAGIGKPAVRWITKILKPGEKTKGNFRCYLAVILGGIGDMAAGPSLLALVEKDEDPWLRGSAADALGKIGCKNALPVLLARLGNEGDKEIRSIFFEAILKLRPDKSHISTFIKLLKNKHEDVQTFAKESLAAIGLDSSHLPALYEMFKGEDIFLQIYAVKEIKKIKGAAGFLAGQLDKEKDIEILGRIIELLGEMGDTSVFSALVKMLVDGKSASLRKILLAAAEKIVPDASHRPILMPLLLNADKQIYAFAVSKLEILLKEKGINEADAGTLREIFTKAKEQDRLTVRAQAVVFLGMGNEVTRANTLFFLEALGDENPDVSASAAAVLKKARLKKEDVHALLKALEKGDENIHAYLFEVLDGLGLAREDIPDLMEIVKKGRPAASEYAKKALNRLGLDRTNIPDLVEMLGFRAAQAYAKENLDKLGLKPENIKDLKKVLPVADWYAKVYIAGALGKIGGKEATATLIGLLGEGNNLSLEIHQAAAIADSAAGALIKIGKTAVPDVREALKSPKSNVRAKAAEVLEKINDVDALPVLIEAKVAESDVMAELSMYQAVDAILNRTEAQSATRVLARFQRQLLEQEDGNPNRDKILQEITNALMKITGQSAENK